MLLSSTADQFAIIALIWVVLETTGSPAVVGAVVLCNRLPAALSAPLCGILMDRGNVTRLIMMGFVVRAACLCAYPLLLAADILSVPIILTLSVVVGAASPLVDVGMRVIVPRIVREQDLPSANGLLSVGDQFPYLIGPALAGAFVAVAGGTALLMPAAMCLLAAWLLRGMFVAGSSTETGEPEPDQTERSGQWFGFRPLLVDPALRALSVLTLVYFVSYGPLAPALPLYSDDQLQAGAVGYGLLWSAIGAGGLAGLVTLPWLARKRPGVVNALGAVLWGALLLLLLPVHTLALAVVVLFAAGFVWAPYVATEISVIQRRVPARNHGAVFGARRALLVTSSPVGAALGGLLLENMATLDVIALSAVMCVVAGAGCLALPSVRAIQPPRKSDTDQA
jgi:MFS family permease